MVLTNVSQDLIGRKGIVEICSYNRFDVTKTWWQLFFLILRLTAADLTCNLAKEWQINDEHKKKTDDIT